ncbi:helix-turn-helix domain-containing protein [Candidatus Poribacteria bacterium]|nr:helix-turn-helix domain-containing protein [Candidatus Poribacteria bacterium]
MQGFLSLEEAADLYGCQVSKIQEFINQNKLHPIYSENGFIIIRSEVEKLKYKQLRKKMVHARLSEG